MRARAIVAAGFLALVLFVLGGATTAQADTYPVQPPPTVLSISESPPAVAPVAAVEPVAVESRSVSRGLALTGADIIEMVLFGVGLVVVGLAVRQAGRRSRPAAA